MTLISKSKAVKDPKLIDENLKPYSPAQVKKFIYEVKLEALKIVWPGKKVTVSLTAVVIVLSVMVSFYLGTVDLLLGKLIASVLN